MLCHISMWGGTAQKAQPYTSCKNPSLKSAKLLRKILTVTTAGNRRFVLVIAACGFTRFHPGWPAPVARSRAFDGWGCAEVLEGCSESWIAIVHMEPGKQQQTWYVWRSKGSATSPAPLWSHTACLGVSRHVCTEARSEKPRDRESQGRAVARNSWCCRHALIGADVDEPARTLRALLLPSLGRANLVMPAAQCQLPRFCSAWLRPSASSRERLEASNPTQCGREAQNDHTPSGST